MSQGFFSWVFSCQDGGVLCWIEAHPGTAAYLQGFFSVVAIFAAVFVAWWQGKQQREMFIEEHKQAKRMQVHEARAIGLLVRDELDQVKRTVKFEISPLVNIRPVSVPEGLQEVLHRVWIMEERASPVIGVVVLLRAHNRLALDEQGQELTKERIQSAKRLLEGVIDQCDRAISGIDELLDLPERLRRRPPDQQPQNPAQQLD